MDLSGKMTDAAKILSPMTVWSDAFKLHLSAKPRAAKRDTLACLKQICGALRLRSRR